jgi:hypothetical protein
VKLKKATKRLSRIEELLSGVLNGYATDIAEVREPLEAATAAVKRARSAIDSNQSSSKQQSASPSRRTTLPMHKHVPTGKRKGSGSAAASPGKSTQSRKPIKAKGLEGIAEANKRRRANQRAARNAPMTAAQRKSSGPAAKEVPANGPAAQTPTSVPASA